ncbi:hypothetical protein [Pirellula sp. SH-Sr6A]|uniref:hypothetical protein n=1 Tax=Pirellula sp. SH-Sr6A TaxID=1632865 RepID=UPI00143BFECA|nr:hypothetical protein [Pirellula sp. SH-Sr6A]
MRNRSYAKGQKKPWMSDYERRYLRQALAQGTLILMFFFVVMLLAFVSLHR